jgi:hypothetical protein
MKDITIKITGKQCYDGTEEDQMEFVTDGRVYERNGYFYLIYDESEISGLEGFRTTLKFNENSLKMKRFSKEGPGPELYFEEGMYYDAAKYYSEAAEAGYALTRKDRKNFEKAYVTQKKRLQVMIDRCHKDIALGKSPIRPLADLEKEMRQLIEWNTKVKGRR